MAPPLPARDRKLNSWFVLGWLLAAVCLFGLAEAYLRAFPPNELRAYLGDCVTERGCFTPDPDVGFAYRSFDAFCQDNPNFTRRWLSGPDDASLSRLHVWLFIGNSFGFNLSAEVARTEAFRHISATTLDRREPVLVRLAQIKALAQSRHCPERIFLVLTPIDLYGLGEQPVATQTVNRHGALTFKTRLPPAPFSVLVE